MKMANRTRKGSDATMILPIFITLTLTENERDLLEKLFVTYEQPVYSLSNKILRNKADAEDNSIQVFIKLSKVLYRIEPDLQSKRNKAFIYTVTKYAALDMLRKRRTYADKSRINMTECYIDDIRLDDFHYNSLIGKMKFVSEPDTALLVFKYVLGFSSREIAKVTGLTAGAVAVRIHRAKQKMKANDEIREIQEDTI